MDNKKTVAELKNITVAFSGINALTDVNFSLREKEIHCLCGENGAGKSTLIKTLAGVNKPEKGEIIIDGNKYDTLNPSLAHKLGIHTIYQENLLIPDMSVAENIFVGQEKLGKNHLINYKQLYDDAAKILDRIDAPIGPRDTVRDLSAGGQQYVKIARALVFEPSILIMDEPTTMFNSVDAGKLLEMVKKLRDSGISIIYISHKMEEINAIADRVTVLRDGYVVNCYDRSVEDIELSKITTDMVGRSVDLFYKRDRVDIGETVLEVKDLKIGKDSNAVSFSLHRGEILGFAGMVGSGRTEIMESLYGYKKKYSGKVSIHGKEISIKSPSDALSNGMCFITEDRQRTGVILDMPITPNVTLPALDKIKGAFLKLGEEKKAAMDMVSKVNLKALNAENDVRYLSGGNQQKVVISKWLYKDSEIFIFDEPTRGIDVNTKAEIYSLMVDMVRDGKAIIMVSSDMPELISISDRVLVIKEGAVAAELSGDEITEENIIVKTL